MFTASVGVVIGVGSVMSMLMPAQQMRISVVPGQVSFVPLRQTAYSSAPVSAARRGAGEPVGLRRVERARHSARIDPFIQQGPKLIGSRGMRRYRDNPGQGFSVALSRDGNTALIGDIADDNNHGAAWVFVRSGEIWKQQGPKLTGWDAVKCGVLWQGMSVALSADGDTALIGGPADNCDLGATWVFVRSGNRWHQQGPKLVGSGAVQADDHPFVWQGFSVALSASGDTAVIGAPDDNDFAGAAWVFARSGSTWSQQGPKLVGDDPSPVDGSAAGRGSSVALSRDGSTALIGGPQDDGGLGAAWVFVRLGSSWAQQGRRLVGSGAARLSNGSDAQGSSVALSGDGNTALIGGSGDDGVLGASWVFSRSGNQWTQQGSKLVGTGGMHRDPGFNGGQGASVALSDDGHTALVGDPNDNTDLGAVWVFVRSRSKWRQLGRKLVGSGTVRGHAVIPEPGQGSAVAVSGNGATALIGDANDDSNRGATWVFVRRPPGPCIDPDHDHDCDRPRPA